MTRALPAVCVLLLATVARAEPPPIALRVAPAMVKIRPAKPLPAEARVVERVELTAVRGECEAFHLVATATDAPLRGLVVSAAPLVSRAGATLPITLYREAFLNVRTPSNTEGDAGEWPDALIPVVDAIAREPRNAFPVDVAARRNQPVFVEICVPAGAPAGRWDGAVEVRADGRPPRSLPVRLDVRAVTIPATSSLPVTFGLSGRSLMYGHFGEKRGDDARLALVRRYALSALAHRISLHTMSRIPPPVTKRDDGGVDVDFRGWDAEIGPLMDGTALPSGARFSAIDLRTPDDLPPALARPYDRAVAAHFREKGWLDRLFAYVMDEPKPDQRGELVRRLDLLAGTGIARLVTMPLEAPLAGKVDLWVPNLNCLEYKAKPREFCAVQTPRADYRAREAKGERLWWYQSCSSHGCGHGPFGDARDAYFRDWPSYMVDVDGASTRVMGWLAFANDVGGELYFDTANAFNRWDAAKPARVDPWDDLFLFGGNGDGTLFYPGRPDRIGGRTDVPVESLRLKLIRDGLEEYELLRLLAARDPAGDREARALARAIAPRIAGFAHDLATWERTRRALIDALAPALPEGASARPPARQ